MEINDLIHTVLYEDKDAYELIIKQYWNDIYFYVYKQIGDNEKSQELSQDIFYEAYYSLKRYNKDKAAFNTWLFKIANYHCMDYLKSRAYKEKQKTTYETIEQSTKTNDDALSTIIKKEKLTNINQLMQKQLKPKHERIMRYHFYADLSPQEIATIEKMNVKSVYTIINRSLEKLKQSLGGI